MSNDLPLILLSVCGFATVCIGLIVVVGLLLIRFTGSSFLLPLVNAFTGRGDESGDDDEGYRPTPARRAPTANDLRARAQSLDFDSAVQKYQRSDQPQTNLPPASTNPIPGSAVVPPNTLPLDDPTSRYSLRNRSASDRRSSPEDRERRRRADEGEDILSGFLSSDED